MPFIANLFFKGKVQDRGQKIVSFEDKILEAFSSRFATKFIL